ncbi:hypothetical protein M5J14_18605 [Lysinibacillus sp. OL1_EC]|uniref:hypothetical protein n=1 Tax=unclassified Lysinibacillus TaxID=2636778 RepID=UPI00103C2732|nr:MULTISPECIES: hypothetical protein [unclassified Lysinibacillus]MCM0626510.1 hypothetical protein [Lysinibacillus sp. OL1_EC]TBV85629.1 hypothetical protein EW028_19580 [Lysinibacillus sp. OL1]
MKAIEDLEKRLRGEMVSRMDDRDIVDILEVLQGAGEEIERLEKERAEAYQAGYKQGKFDELMDNF